MSNQQNTGFFEVTDDALNLPPRPEREQPFQRRQAVVCPVATLVKVPFISGIFRNPVLHMGDKDRTVCTVFFRNITVKVIDHVSTFPSFRLSLSMILALYMSMFWRR